MSFRAGATDLGPTVIRGRRPGAVGEVALHPSLLRELGLDVGDRTLATIGRRSAPLTVVGTVVTPLDVASFESGSAMTFEGLRSLLVTLRVPTADQMRTDIVVVDLRGGADALTVSRRLQRNGVVREGLMIADDLTTPEAAFGGIRLDGVAQVPFALGVLAAVLTVLVMVFLVVDRVRDWRSELALHRVIGFGRDQIRRSVLLGSTALTLVIVGIAVPLGVAAGRAIWLSYAARLGARPEASAGWGLTALAVVGVAAVGWSAALTAGWLVCRARPGPVLRMGDR
jgi:hypothetical protein